MEQVTGIGGIFFRARDAVALGKWYQTHLGIDPVPQTQDEKPWMTADGPTVFAPFPHDTTYFSADKSVMINFRVGNLAALLSQLDEAGISYTSLPDMPGVGRFAHLTDPEGNPIELWEPESG